MRVPISWLRQHVTLPSDVTARQVGDELIRLGLEVETVEPVADITGPLVVGRVQSIEELTEFKKPIRFCQVHVGDNEVRGIVCGARNFAEGDLIVAALPGSVLPGGFAIAARQTYGKTSDGMFCSESELGLSTESDGILVLDPDSASVGENALSLLGLDDEVLDIAVTPDRGYALSIRGVAREAAIAFTTDFVDSVLESTNLPSPVSDTQPRSCTSEDPQLCDVFTLRTLTDVDPSAPTPAWMAARLRAAGMRPVSVIVDITNYVMLETGQPLHAFDADVVSGGLVARRAQAGETLETLDHVVRELDSEDLVIADDSGPLALAGTMGGVTSEISSTSTNVLLEAAHFDAITVAKMSRRHRLSSEASRRFERGVDSALAPYASERAAALLVELAGARNCGMIGVEHAHEPVAIRISSQLPSDVSGASIDEATVIDNLRLVGCDVETHGDADPQQLVVRPPTWRPDLTDPADLVEEVIRLVGYDSIPATLPTPPAGRGLTAAQVARRRALRVIAGLGFVETLSYPFVGDKDFEQTGITADDPRRQVVRVANPLSDEQPGLRTTLLPGLLATARRNVSRGNDNLAISEAGLVFLPELAAPGAPRPDLSTRPTEEELDALDRALPHQPLHLAVVMTGQRDRAGWWGKGRSASWDDALGAAKAVADDLGVTVEVATATMAPFHPGRCAQLSVDGNVIGHAGELHPKVVAAWGLPERATAFELDVSALIERSTATTRTAPQFSTFPVAKEDVALIVDSNVASADVAQALRDGGGNLIESVRLFDVYTGEQVPEGHRSLAFAIRMRAADHTLTVEEVSEVRQAALSAAESACGARLRD